jgi:hypothetical protein
MKTCYISPYGKDTNLYRVKTSQYYQGLPMGSHENSHTSRNTQLPMGSHANSHINPNTKLHMGSHEHSRISPNKKFPIGSHENSLLLWEFSWKPMGNCVFRLIQMYKSFHENTRGLLYSDIYESLHENPWVILYSDLQESFHENMLYFSLWKSVKHHKPNPYAIIHMLNSFFINMQIQNKYQNKGNMHFLI